MFYTSLLSDFSLFEIDIALLFCTVFLGELPRASELLFRRGIGISGTRRGVTIRFPLRAFEL
jgi:hypothetical protein